jgi:hypothetical protein
MRIMAQISRGFSKAGPVTGIVGAMALTLAFGAVAWGRDLVKQGDAGPLLSADASAAAINRSAKGDRAARPAGPAMQTQTYSLRLHSLSDTSVLIRVPMATARASEIRVPGAIEAQSRKAPSLLMKPGEAKAMDACEPSVSVLTEVAKQLQPGRCVS